MPEEIMVLGIIAIIFIAFPGMVLHFITRWKEIKSLSTQDEESFGDLRQLADKLEDRLRIMERILDDEVPDWRSRYYDR